MRAFIAITPPKDIVSEIGEITKSLSAQFPQINWETPEKVHLTIAFFGILSEERLELISQVLREITQTTPPITLKVTSLSYFHRRHDDSVVFLDVKDESRALRVFYNEFKRRLDAEKIFLPERIKLHITIGRLKRMRKLHESKRILAEFARTDILEVGEFTATSFDFYESLPARDRQTTRYQLIESFPLNKKEKQSSHNEGN